MANSSKPVKPGGPRSASRLAATQAFYQLLMSETPNIKGVIREYVDHRLGAELEEGVQLVAADPDMFADLLEGAWERREEWIELITPHLQRNWSFERLDKLIIAILSVGSYELAARIDVPTAVVINEYVDVTHSFYEPSEASFVNSILDKVAKALRS